LKKSRAHFLLQVKSAGWVGVGWLPPGAVDVINTMKGADLILCHLDPANNNLPTCRDSFALDVGEPTLDTVLPGKKRENQIGTNDVTVESFDITNGYVNVIFNRRLSTNDPNDHTIGNDQRVFFAYNPSTYELRYHGPTRSSSQLISWIREYQGPPVEVTQDLWIKIILYIWTSISIIISFVVIVLIIVKREYFIFNTPEVCLIMCAGSILAYISVILLLPDILSDGMCYAHIWLFGIGFWLVFSGLLLKNFRVFYVFAHAEKMKVKKMNYQQLLLVLIIFLVMEAIFNIIWDSVPALRPNLSRYDFLSSKTYVYYCAGNKWMWLGSVLVRIFILGVNAVLAFISRGLRKEQNYARETALAIYTGFIILIVAIPLGFALSDTPVVVVLLKGISICLGFNAVILITFFDSVFRIATKKPARTFTSSVTVLTGSGKLESGSTGINLSGSSLH